jgi:hypothetical protein
MKVQVFTFVVEGTGSFPVDMLRYDRCCPYEQEDTDWAFAQEGTRSAKMICYNGKPTPARWNSFGWSVDMVTTA